MIKYLLGTPDSFAESEPSSLHVLMLVLINSWILLWSKEPPLTIISAARYAITTGANDKDSYRHIEETFQYTAKRGSEPREVLRLGSCTSLK
jgi:hypothetical protein